jgi:coenzyme Q-binding protein COQ10
LHHHVERRLPYTPDQLFALVGDVERYPDFVPWLKALRTWNAHPIAEGLDSLDAEATVAFAGFRERFSSRVRRDAKARRIDVNLISGPFKTLVNRWIFHEDPGGTRVEFDIEFAFKSQILTRLLSANLHHAADRLIGCFEERARKLYAAPAAQES